MIGELAEPLAPVATEVKVPATLGPSAVPVAAETTIGEARQTAQDWNVGQSSRYANLSLTGGDIFRFGQSYDCTTS